MSDASLNDLIPSNNPSNISKLIPRIYVACLASYNNGLLYGKWINATQKVELIEEEIKTILLKSPIPNAEEFVIHDFEGFGSLSIDEYESIQSIQKIAVFISEVGELGAMLLSYYGNIDSARDALENHYYGEFDNELEFAIQLFDDLYMASIPDAAQAYIDYASFKRDIFIDDYLSIEVREGIHVFSR